MMTHLNGQLLVASPYLEDQNFARSVILLLQHMEEGAVGVVLNRPVNVTVRSLWDELWAGDCDNDARLNFGGPVSGPLMALHTDKTLGELSLPQGIYVAAHKDNLEALVHQTDHPFRMYLGHAGWTGGQLEDELNEGTWLTLPAQAQHVFAPHDDLWEDSVKKVGRSVIHSALRIKHVPFCPSLN